MSTPSTHTHQTISTHQTDNAKGTRRRGGGGGRKGDKGAVCPCVKSFEIASERAEKKERERSGPKSWFERKFAVGIVIGLFGWSNYVLWDVILRRCWVRAEDALVGFAAGVVLTILYGFFTLMFILTYLKVILSQPGFAKDHVKQSEPPLAPEPAGVIYNYAYNPVITPSSSHLPNNVIFDGGDDHGHIVYPPSRKAPTSEYRHSMDDDDRITHESVSLEDHGEFEAGGGGDGDGNRGHSNTWLHEGSNTNTNRNAGEPVSVPYEKMPSRPLQAHTYTHTRSTSASASIIPIPIPPTTPKSPSHQRSYSTGYPPSPIPSPSPSPTQKTRANKLVRGGSTGGGGGGRGSGSGGRGPAIRLDSLTSTSKQSPTTQAGVGTGTGGFKPPMSPTSRSPTTPTTAPMETGTGFHFESTLKPYIPDPLRPPPQAQTTPHTGRTRSGSLPRSRADSHPPSTHSHSHSKHVSPFDEQLTPYQHQHQHRTPHHSRPTPYQPDRPIPYLDDLPPIAPTSLYNDPSTRWDRKPPERPVLAPYYRYCSRDGLIKPPRCHHCRICNTCVLGYDHHCPWVGGCVGAQNRKFFVVFLFWSTLYLTYTLPLLIATLVTRADPSRPITFTTTSLDPNIVALLIVTILFGAFSAGMLGTHVHLLRRNASTVEWHGVQEMKERERAVVSQLVPVCECLGMGRGERGNGGLLGWKDEEVGVSGGRGVSAKGFKGRVELRKRWDDEWGRIGKEGNLWWLGSGRVNWEAVMGKNPWTWFLPVGNMAVVGVDYPRNPRFDEQGRWMKRENWPEELR